MTLNLKKWNSTLVSIAIKNLIPNVVVCKKYCSNTCRSKAHHARKKTENKIPKISDTETKIEVATTPVLPKKN
ncbi:hypothetical protein [Algibacter sp. L1A34]|uniref:hypothetical protein n=1 Tax=Algibacter sp. L1A34 TaxID=2686365 RepID=UPI00131E51E8|nr:hypothetical protein [Algibacter sp. L1A34]